eukprot:226419_1
MHKSESPQQAAAKYAIREFMAILPQDMTQFAHLSCMKEMCLAVLDDTSPESFFEDCCSSQFIDPPICEIGVTFSKSKDDLPSTDCVLVEKSVAGKIADVNKGSGGRPVFFYYRRSSTEKPITAVTVVVADLDEEAPHGFEEVTTTPADLDADLNAGSHGRRLLLCVSRGSGPPVQNIVVVFPTKEECPPNFQLIERTPRGRSGDLNYGSDGRSVKLAIELDVPRYLSQFKLFAEWTHNSGMAQCLACLSMALFSFNQTMVQEAMNIFQPVPEDETEKPGKGLVDDLSPDLTSVFMTAFCDCLVVYLSYFSGDVHLNYMHFIRVVFERRLPSIHTLTVMRIFETCLFLRHEDARIGLSRDMLTCLVRGISVPAPCQCQGGPDFERKAQCRICSRWDENAAETPENFQDINGDSSTAIPKEGIAEHSLSSDIPKEGISDPAVISDSDNAETRSDRSIGSNENAASTSPNDALSPSKSATEPLNYVAALESLNAHTIISPEIATAASPTIAAAASPTVAEFSESLAIIRGTVHGQVLAKAAEEHVRIFLRKTVIDNEFRSDMASFVKALYTDPYQRALAAVVVLLSKFACQPLPEKLTNIVLSGRSERIKRRIHALQHLFSIFEQTPYFFQSSPEGIVLLRRIFCTSLVDNCATVVPALFQMALKFFVFLWSHFIFSLKHELGEILNFCLLGMLKSSNCTPGQKVDLIEALGLVFSSPQSIVDLFYNFDNDYHSSNLLDGLIATVSKLTEATLNASNKYGMPEDKLQQAGLTVMTNVMDYISRWVSDPPPANDSDSSSDDISETGSMNPASSPGVLDEASVASRSLTGRSNHRLNRSNTWSIRFDTLKERQRIQEEALQIAHSEKVSKAVKYLWQIHPNPTISYIAKFLYRNTTLDKSEVGDLIGSQELRGIFNEKDMNELRKEYVTLLDFTSLSFDEALRHFLCDSNFRLPGESQKVDRVLESFADRYFLDNPGIFQNGSGAFLTAFALIMLNTDHHDPRLRSGASSRAPMTKDQFLRNMRGAAEISEDFLVDLFDGVVKREIKWKDDTEVEYELNENVDHTKIQGEFRDECQVICRKCLASLRCTAFDQSMFVSTGNREIARGIFSLIWYRYLGTLTIILETIKDTEILAVCLDGIKFSTMTALNLGLNQELNAFCHILARFIFSETHKEMSRDEMNKMIVRGEHLQVDWLQDIKRSALKNPSVTLKRLFVLINEIKSRVVYSNNQDALKKIEQDFAGQIMLTHQIRTFLRAGTLTKVSSSNKLQPYHFFLFSDFLLYAAETYTAFKYHRAMHLTLVQIVDIPNSKRGLRNAFKLISPKKAVTVFASTEQGKSEWLEAITSAIQATLEDRDRWITEEAKISGISLESAPERSRLLSLYIGRSTGSGLHLLDDETDAVPCKICVRPFTMMRRSTECPWCRDLVCKSCCSQSFKTPNSSRRRKVCDGCFRFLRSESVSDAPRSA